MGGGGAGHRPQLREEGDAAACAGPSDFGVAGDRTVVLHFFRFLRWFRTSLAERNAALKMCRFGRLSILWGRGEEAQPAASTEANEAHHRPDHSPRLSAPPPHTFTAPSPASMVLAQSSPKRWRSGSKSSCTTAGLWMMWTYIRWYNRKKSSRVKWPF